MVKVGFIVEGDTEEIILKSIEFGSFLQTLNIERVGVINTEGSKNMLPRNIGKFREALQRRQAEKVIILTDLDDDVCVTKTKKRIEALPEEIVVIAVQKIESWFLADTLATSQFLGKSDFYIEFPEQETVPFESLKQIRLVHSNRGIGDKKLLARNMLRCGFSLQRAAQHPNCHSAAYFLKKLHSLNHNIV